MNKIVPIVPEEFGNTKQIPPSKHWCFTLNNYKKTDIDDILNLNSSIVPKFIFQEEVGECGTPHLQGYIMFKTKKRPKSIFNNERIHWEKCRNIKAAIEYCQKEDTRNGKIYYRGIKKPPKCINPDKPWQQNVLAIVEREPDDRSIYWFWDEVGGIGKSALAKYLAIKKNALVLSGKAADMKYAICKMLEKNEEPGIIIIDIPRSYKNFLSYTGIEEIKNGCFFNTKYESQMCVFNAPHILVFANSEPNYEAMSKDRWIVEELK